MGILGKIKEISQEYPDSKMIWVSPLVFDSILHDEFVEKDPIKHQNSAALLNVINVYPCGDTKIVCTPNNEAMTKYGVSHDMECEMRMDIELTDLHWCFVIHDDTKYTKYKI